MLSILITNIVMSERTGTETATFELAMALYKKGHRVIVYSPSLGRLAMELCARGVPVVDDVSKISFVPDIIHGNHNVALATAMIRFRTVPAVFICHDTISPFDEPIITNRIISYIAVDYACRARLLASGVTEQKTEIVINAVDTERFKLKSNISQTPKTALCIVKAFHRNERKEHYIRILTEACKARNISMDLVGRGVDNEVEDLSSIVSKYDICFSFSRSAMEACCTGAHVVVTDEFGYGGVLDATVARRWPGDKLSRHIASGALTYENVLSGIDTYQADFVKKSALAWRKLVSSSSLIKKWEKIYHAAIDAYRMTESFKFEDGDLFHFISGFLPRAISDVRSVAVAKHMSNHFIRLDDINSLVDFWSGDMRFGDGSLLRSIMLGAGWSHPEQWGVWSCDTSAMLNIPVKLLKKYGNIVYFNCTHYFPSCVEVNEIAKVTAFVGDKPIGSMRFSKKMLSNGNPSIKRLKIPGRLLDITDNMIHIRLVMDQPRSPALFDGKSDHRNLGFGIVSVRLTHDKALNYRSNQIVNQKK